MNEPNNTNESIFDHLKSIVRDGIGYLSAQIEYLEARTTEFILSSLLFIVLIIFACLSGFTFLVLVGVAIGVWLAQITGSTLISLLILCAIFFLISGPE
jgi:uncharacterized membrane protein